MFACVMWLKKRGSSNMGITWETFFTHRSSFAWLASGAPIRLLRPGERAGHGGRLVAERGDAVHDCVGDLVAHAPDLLKLHGVLHHWAPHHLTDNIQLYPNIMRRPPLSEPGRGAHPFGGGTRIPLQVPRWASSACAACPCWCARPWFHTW